VNTQGCAGDSIKRELRRSLLGRRYVLPPPAALALTRVFGEPVGGVIVIERSRYARAHLGMCATTRSHLGSAPGRADLTDFRIRRDQLAPTVSTRGSDTATVISHALGGRRRYWAAFVAPQLQLRGDFVTGHRWPKSSTSISRRVS
jgi:hypothetical protein